MDSVTLKRLSHKSYYKNELNKTGSNLKNAWQILREMICNRSKFSNNREFLIDGNKTQDKQLISDRFNETRELEGIEKLQSDTRGVSCNTA